MNTIRIIIAPSMAAMKRFMEGADILVNGMKLSIPSVVVMTRLSKTAKNTSWLTKSHKGNPASRIINMSNNKTKLLNRTIMNLFWVGSTLFLRSGMPV